MLSWLFGAKDQAKRADDAVWMSAPARRNGICREVERHRKAGRSVIVVALATAEFEDLARALNPPLLCRDVFSLHDLRAQLAGAQTFALALAHALTADARLMTCVPLELLVCGRSVARAADESILRFADAFGSHARLCFHVSLDDSLLKEHTAALKPLLTRLNVSADEAISSPMVTRAIARAQAKAKRPA